jgi:ketosteroid isomerase-like protein
MTQENADLVRAIMEAYRNPDVMAMLAGGELDLGMVDPEIEWDASRLTDMIPDLAEVYHGHEGVRAYWRRWFEAWDRLEFDVQDVLDAGDDVVVLIHNQRQWGRHTGIRTELPPYAQVFTVRDGSLIRWRTFPDQDSALEALGLRQPPPPDRGTRPSE